MFVGEYSYDTSSMFDEVKSESFNSSKNDGEFSERGEKYSKESLRERMNGLQKELEDLRSRRQQQEAEVANIENMALRQRFQDILDNLLTEQMQKEQEVPNLWHKYLRYRKFKILAAPCSLQLYPAVRLTPRTSVTYPSSCSIYWL